MMPVLRISVLRLILFTFQIKLKAPLRQMSDFTLSPLILAAILCNAPPLVLGPPPPLLIIIAVPKYLDTQIKCFFLKFRPTPAGTEQKALTTDKNVKKLPTTDRKNIN